MNVGESEIKRFLNLVGNLEELPLQEYECPIHGIFKSKPYIIMGKVFTPMCPICEKEEKERNDRLAEEGIMRQRKKEKEELIEELKNMNIGQKFWDEDFTTFNPYTPELKRHFDICSAFVNDFEGRILIMLGNHGNGKNHLAAAILKKMGGYMYSVFEMELLIRQSYKTSAKESEFELYERLCNAPLLVINEIGKHKLGEWDQFFLSYIINKRYENMKPIILISNGHLKEKCPVQNPVDGGGCEKCFENYLGEDVISRIIECGEIMEFTGDDYRQRKRIQGGKNE